MAAADSDFRTARLVQFKSRETFLLSVVCVVLAWELFRGMWEGIVSRTQVDAEQTKSRDTDGLLLGSASGSAASLLAAMPPVAVPQGWREDRGLGGLWLAPKNVHVWDTAAGMVV